MISIYRYYDFSELFKPSEVVDYLRKSRSDDPTLTVEEVLSKHEAILDEWSEKNLGGKIPEENKYREVVSGETIADRPEMQKLLKRIESPAIKAVKVVEVQRLSRGDLEDAGRLIKLLRYTNTYVITPQKTYDLSDDYDRDTFERELKRGNEYLEYTKKIMNNGRLLSVSQGNYIASLPPYGYDKTWVTEGKRKCPTLKENKEQADVVRMIFDLYVNKQMGCKKICNYLNGLGVQPPRGEYWSSAGMRDMLTNVHYIGKVKWNWRKTVTVVEDSEIVKMRPKSKDGDYLIYDGKHSGIISEKLFYEAQSRIGKNHREKASTKIRNPFASLLYCRCGTAMTLKFYPSRSIEPRLSCNKQTICNTGSCCYSELVRHVCNILREHIRSFEALMEADDGKQTDFHAKSIASLERRLREIEATELSQWEAQSHPDPAQRMPVEVFKKLNANLLREKEEVQKALIKAHETAPTRINYAEAIVKFKDALHALENPTMEPEEKNKLLKMCIERIDYTRERPQLLRHKPNSKLSVGANWTNPPIKLDIQLNI